MRTRYPLLTIAAAAAVGLAGCASDDAGDDTDTGTTAEEPAAGTEDATEDGAAGDAPTVTVQDIAFQEQTVTVAAGTAVTWVNEDSVAHTVTSGTPDEATDVFDEELPADGEVSITVDEPGTYPYFCEIHPDMTAELVVE